MTIKLTIIIAILVCLAGCNILIPPVQPRDNPFAEANPMPMNLNITPRTEYAGNTYCLLVDMNLNPDRGEIRGFTLIKNENAPR